MSPAGVIRSSAPSLLTTVLLLGACAAPHTVRTVGKGKTALNVSMGGPLFSNLVPGMPVPNIAVGAQYGITDAWDVHSNFHVLPAVYRNLALDAGVTRRLVRQRKGKWWPELTLTLRLNMITSFHAFRLYPELHGYASYLFKNRWLLYLGMTTFYDFFWEKGNHFRMHWGPTLGCDVRFAKRYSVGLSFRWISPQEDTSRLTLEWASPGRQGWFFIQVSFRVNFAMWGGAS